MSDIRPFRLSPSFVQEFENKQPEWGFNGLGYVVYKRTYSRLKPDGNQEEFWETCVRVVEGVYNIQKKHCFGLGLEWDNAKAQRSAQEMFLRMWQFKWLPPGRGLWMMGTEYVDKVGSAALNNCGMISTETISRDFAQPYCWMMDMSMLGVGVGYDTRGAGTITLQDPKIGDDVFVVEDSREGWVSLLRRVLLAYSGIGSLPASVDYSKIRVEGTPIKGFGGTSSGAGPLIDFIDCVHKLLKPAIGSPITSEVLSDLGNLVGRCVVSGNIRRSALLVLGDPTDASFLDLKNPDINQEAMYHHRWSANNSVFAHVGMDYSKVAELTSKNGEPGYFWLDHARQYSRMDGVKDNKDRLVMGVNPCSEQSLHDAELCCLVETFPSRHSTYDDFKKTLKCAYLYAKSVTLVPTHDPLTNQVMLKNRRIGTSMSGIIQAMNKHGRREFLNWCDKGYNYVKELDKSYSDWLCIRESIKITTVKPSGSISLLPGVTPGIHFPHSKHYIRRVRFQRGHPLAVALETSGYPVEEDKYSPNTVVVSFPVEEELFDRSKSDVSMWEQLEIAAQLQRYWADNQVSVTVTFKPEEAKDIRAALELYETRLKSVSFLPLNDHGYEQAPYETITHAQYDAMKAGITEVDYSALSGDSHDTNEKFCTNDVCEIPPSDKS